MSTRREEFDTRQARDARWRELRAAGKKVHKSTDQVVRHGQWKMVWLVLIESD